MYKHCWFLIVLNLEKLSDNDFFEQCSQFLLMAVVDGSGGRWDVEHCLPTKLDNKGAGGGGGKLDSLSKSQHMHQSTHHFDSL